MTTRNKKTTPRPSTIVAAVQCTFCGAMRGELCWDKHGRQVTTYVHRGRRGAYRRKRGKLPKSVAVRIDPRVIKTEAT